MKTDEVHELITMLIGELYRDDVLFSRWHTASWIKAAAIGVHVRTYAREFGGFYCWRQS